MTNQRTEHRYMAVDGTWSEWKPCPNPGCRVVGPSVRTRFIEEPDHIAESLRKAFVRMAKAGQGITVGGPMAASDAQILEYARACLAFDELLTPENLA